MKRIRLLAVGEHLGERGLVALPSLAGDLHERVADGCMLFRRPHRLRRQNGEPERFEFRNVFEEPKLLEFAVERRECLGGRPVLDVHSVGSIGLPARNGEATQLEMLARYR